LNESRRQGSPVNSWSAGRSAWVVSSYWRILQPQHNSRY